jgi:hypothetical protein
MKSIRSSIPAVLAWFLISSCGAGGNNPAINSTSAASASSGDGGFTGDGSLAYTVDGKTTSIKTTLVKNGANMVALFVNDVKNDPATGIVKVEITNYLTYEVFKFKVANKGATSIMHYSPSFNDTKIEGEYMSPKYENFYADSATVTISQLTDARVAGTFSGKFINGNHNKSVELTNGSFDIPIPPAKAN